VVEGLQRASTEVQSARIGRALITDRRLGEVVTDFRLDDLSVLSGKCVLGLFGQRVPCSLAFAPCCRDAWPWLRCWGR
jgi:hypothetical protein